MRHLLFLLSAGCFSPPGLVPLDVNVATPKREGTVLEVTWRTDTPCVGRLLYAGPDGLERQSRPEDGPRRLHRRFILGLPQATDVGFTIRCVDAADVHDADPLTATTGLLPAGMDELVLEGEAEPSTELLTLPLLGATTAATLVDLSGRIVWYHESARGSISRVRLGKDRESILYNVNELGSIPTGEGRVVRVGLDGTELAVYDAPLATHDFVELPDGTVTTISSLPRTVDGVEVLGDQLVELAPDGTATVVWTSFDSFDPAVDTPLYDGAQSWTHANALDYDADTDSYWLGLRNLDAIVRIERATGQVVEQIGGTAPTMEFADPASAFHGQHQFQWLDDGVLVFDNRYGDHESRAVEYGTDGGVLTQRWSWTPDPTVWNYALGDVHRDDDGRTRVTLSMAGRVVQLDASGQVQWELHTQVGSVVGYSERVGAVVGEP